MGGGGVPNDGGVVLLAELTQLRRVAGLRNDQIDAELQLRMTVSPPLKSVIVLFLGLLLKGLFAKHKLVEDIVRC